VLRPQDGRTAAELIRRPDGRESAAKFVVAARLSELLRTPPPEQSDEAREVDALLKEAAALDARSAALKRKAADLLIKQASDAVPAEDEAAGADGPAKKSLQRR
jgi:hypothetical protein